MGEDRLRGALEEGEALRFETSLRRGGRLGVTDERVVVVRPDEIVGVTLENVGEVTIQSIDWFLVVLSVALVGVGGYGVLVMADLLLGASFVVVAVANLYLTYRKRDRVRLRLHTRPKPITLYVDDTDALRLALERALDPFRDDER